jgi:hypothetical protein
MFAPSREFSSERWRCVLQFWPVSNTEPQAVVIIVIAFRRSLNRAIQVAAEINLARLALNRFIARIFKRFR